MRSAQAIFIPENLRPRVHLAVVSPVYGTFSGKEGGSDGKEGGSDGKEGADGVRHSPPIDDDSTTHFKTLLA